MSLCEMMHFFYFYFFFRCPPPESMMTDLDVASSFFCVASNHSNVCSHDDL